MLMMRNCPICLFPMECLPWKLRNTTKKQSSKIMTNRTPFRDLLYVAFRKNYSKEFQRKMDSEDNNSMTDENYFSSPAIISIENTFNTKENGRYIFIVLKESFHEVRAFLQDFCSKKFKEIYATQEERDDYRIMYKGLPHLQLSPNAGGGVAKLTARIIQKLDDAGARADVAPK
jgi:hypothetical protein